MGLFVGEGTGAGAVGRGTGAEVGDFVGAGEIVGALVSPNLVGDKVLPTVGAPGVSPPLVVGLPFTGGLAGMGAGVIEPSNWFSTLSVPNSIQPF